MAGQVEQPLGESPTPKSIRQWLDDNADRVILEPPRLAGGLYAVTASVKRLSTGQASESRMDLTALGRGLTRELAEYEVAVQLAALLGKTGL